jgi:hypothetical protein
MPARPRNPRGLADAPLPIPVRQELAHVDASVAPDRVTALRRQLAGNGHGHADVFVAQLELAGFVLANRLRLLEAIVREDAPYASYPRDERRLRKLADRIARERWLLYQRLGVAGDGTTH